MLTSGKGTNAVLEKKKKKGKCFPKCAERASSNPKRVA